MTIHNSNIKLKRSLYHIAFWTLWVALNTIFLGSAEDTYYRQFITELYELPEKMVVVYLNLYLLIPRMLLKKKYFQYGSSLFLLLFNMSLIMRGIYVEFLAARFFPDTVNLPFFQPYRLFKYIFYNLNAVIFITTVIRLISDWYKQQQLNRALEQEKLEAELHYLKGQLNPHFLFNTLNNVYSLCLKKSDLAPGALLKLSSLMSYMLYDSQKDQIDMLKDIEYIKSYIELEMMRYGGRLTVSFNQSGDFENREIAPLLMLPFVENAFKHGLCEDADEIWLTVDAKVKQNTFYLKVRNSVNEDLCTTEPIQHGLGLQNIKRRLDLLYPERHSLGITNDLKYFEVDLKINL